MNTTAVTTPKDERSARQGSAQEPALLPPVDVVEDSTGITLYADMPGVPRDQLNLRVERDTLTLEGEIALPVPQGSAFIRI